MKSLKKDIFIDFLTIIEKSSTKIIQISKILKQRISKQSFCEGFPME